jgi:tRNA (guanine-N7-)-methyltransferase
MSCAGPSPEAVTEGDAAKRRQGQLYGRRKGPQLRPHQARLIETLLPRLRLDLDSPALAEPSQLFAGRAADVWLEIGFGGGEHLAWQAKTHPEIGFIGCEAYVNGIAKLLVAVEAENLSNIRIHDGDARELLARLGEATIGRAFLLFPDPWPKRRHHKRRFVTLETLAALHRIMRPGALFRFASDSGDYVAWTLARVRAHGGFEWLAERPEDWRERLPDWPETRYEFKARRQGRPPVFLSFRRHCDRHA